MSKEKFEKDFKGRKSGKKSEKDFKKKPGYKKEDRVPAPHGVTGLGDNDISWYTMSDQLLNDVARLPFGRPLGNAQSLGLLRSGNYNGQFGKTFVNTDLVIPGIAVIRYRNAYGISGDAASPINVAARALYSFVRHANSGHTNYESPDLMMYMFAVSEIYTAISYVTKVYGTTQFWSQRNRYFGDRLIAALGFDPVNVRENISDLRAQINMLSVKANSLVAPKDFPLFERRYFLPAHIYKDQDNEKAQIYTFMPTAIGRFTGTKVSTGSAIIPVTAPWFAGNCTVAQATQFISDLLDEMLAEEDLGIMGGDVLKAFKDKGVHQLLSIPDAYACVPVYNEEMLQQIHNMNIGAYDQSVAESDWGTTSITVTADNDILRWHGGTGLVAQNNGYILTEFTTRAYEASMSVAEMNLDGTSASIWGANLITPKVAELVIDTHIDDPTPSDVMIATRLAFDITDTSYSFAGANHYILRSCGLEVVTAIDVITTSESATLMSKAILESRCEYGIGATKKCLVGIADDSNNQYEADATAAHLLLKFRKAPLLVQLIMDYTFSTSGAWSTVAYTGKFFNDVDVTYCAPLASRVLENLHQSALLSVFRIPQLGMFNI